MPNAWWQHAVVYQIYPRSFAESGDTRRGVGNVRGVIDHLDHLSWLGVDALWLSPVFRSPMADFGYDISDFCDVDPVFGTLADVDELIEQCHARGIRLLLDWVPNHTSDQHPWFVESRSSRSNPKAHWYVWRDEPANNWYASFPKGDSAWQFGAERGQYYLRSFTPEQPDLDWDVPEVEAAMLNTLRFWLDRGVDGFRMDVVHLIGKDLTRDDPPQAAAKAWPHVPFNDVAVTHERLRRIRAVLDSYPGERTSVGEVYLLDEAAIAPYYGNGDELHLSFNFAFLWAAPTASSLRERIARTLEHLAPVGAWPTWVLSNHDVVRHRQRHGGSEALARQMAVLLLTLPGTPFLYQGEELGLLDADVPPERVVDPGLRDGCRAPIPWTGDPLHGWPADPWLPFAPEVDHRNVADLTADPDSILHLYRRLVALRRTTDDLLGGTFELIDVGGPGGADTLAYRRGAEHEIVLNLGETAVELDHGLEVLVASDSIEVGQHISAVPPGRAVVGRRVEAAPIA